MNKYEAMDNLSDACTLNEQVISWLASLETPAPNAWFLPVYSQQWKPWASHQLGYGSSTIGGYGCVVTSAASIVSDVLGEAVTPGDVNYRMKQVGGFLPGTGLFIFAKLADAYPDTVRYSHQHICIDAPAPIEDIDAWLALGNYVIVRVDIAPNKAGIQSHYIPLSQAPGDGLFYAVDTWIGSHCTVPPAYAERGDWDAARTIYKVIYYERVGGD